MPELPDIAVYLEALESRVMGRVVLKNPFLLRTAAPALAECEGRLVSSLRRLGKRIAIGLESDLWLVIHLMIAGRLHWYDAAHGVGHSSASLRPRHSHIRVQQIRSALLHLEFATAS